MKAENEVKTLYISDLDGTLLNRNRELSEKTIQGLNRLIANGMNFSVATARTIVTTLPILKEVTVTMPIVLMNGVLVYDMETRKYVNKEFLNQTALERVWTVLQETGQTGLMYALSEEEQLLTFYERLDSEQLKYFINERMERYQKTFTQINHFTDAQAKVICFCFLNSREKIELLQQKLLDTKGLRLEIYQDIYSEDFWYLEVFSDQASKYTAVQFIKQHYGFDRVIGFGDNTNDLPLFDACEECYAVANAIPEIRKKATALIGSNEENGVVNFLLERYSQ